MSYKVIEKNENGVLVEQLSVCQICKYKEEKSCLDLKCGTVNQYYITDSEAEKLESENNLKAKNEELESRIKELEEEKTTELIIEKEDYYGCLTNITKTKCCGIAPITNENYCPNCGRKIIRK